MGVDLAGGRAGLGGRFGVGVLGCVVDGSAVAVVSDWLVWMTALSFVGVLASWVVVSSSVAS